MYWIFRFKNVKNPCGNFETIFANQNNIQYSLVKERKEARERERTSTDRNYHIVYKVNGKTKYPHVTDTRHVLTHTPTHTHIHGYPLYPWPNYAIKNINRKENSFLCAPIEMLLFPFHIYRIQLKTIQSNLKAILYRIR